MTRPYQKKKNNLDLSSWGWQHVKFYKGPCEPSKQMCFTPHVTPNMWYQILTMTSRACVRSISSYGSGSVRSMVVLDLTWSRPYWCVYITAVPGARFYCNEPDSKLKSKLKPFIINLAQLVCSIDTPALLRRQSNGNQYDEMILENVSVGSKTVSWVEMRRSNNLGIHACLPHHL